LSDNHNPDQAALKEKGGGGGFEPVIRYYRFTRPFTLLPPLLGIVSGSVTALGATAHHQGRGFFAQLSAMGAWTVIC